MKLNFFVLFFVLFLFFLFSGCISQEKQFEYKTACLSLTSYSFQNIPECNSQKECFKEVEEQLFDFSHDFSFDSSGKLNSYKNNLASSWLYFNKSRSLVKEINSSCQNNNFSSLPNKTNELAFLLEKAFGFVDKANLDSFSFILIEKNYLSEQEVELIPEELLFDDFILLNQNYNELSTPEINKTSDSYISRYFQVSRKFNEFSSKVGFYSLYLNEFTSADLIGFYQKDALNLVKSDKFYVPLLKKTFSEVLSFIFDFDDLERSVSVLKSMPSNELFALFGDFASPENSVAFEFSLLVSGISEHKTNLKERNNEISSGIESNFNQISLELDGLSLSSINKFDSNVLGFLFEELESNSISEKVHDIYSVENFVFESKEKLFSETIKLNNLKKKDYFNEISLGQKTSSLKEVNSKIISLEEDVGFYSNELFDELIVLCDSKIKLIEESLSKTDFSGKPWEINSIASRIEVKISSFEDASKEEKLFYCKDVILLNKTLLLALEDKEKFFLQSEKSLNQCFDSLERIFYSKNLSVFVDSFYSLKSLKNSSLPVSYISSSCIDLKERIIKYLYSNDKEIIEVNSLYFNSRELLSKLSFLSRLYPKFFSSKKMKSFAGKLDGISAHFSSNKLSFDFFEFSSEELVDLKEFNSELNSFFITYLEKFLSENYSLKAISSEPADYGKTFLVRQKLFFPNPLGARIDSELSFTFPGDLRKTAFFGSCIKEIVKEGDNSRILVSCLPKNGLFIEFDKNQLIPFDSSFELIDVNETNEEETLNITELIFEEKIDDSNNLTEDNSLKEKILNKIQSLKEKEFVLNEKKELIAALFSRIGNALSESEFYLAPITKKRLSHLKESFGKLGFFFISDNNSLEDLLLAEQELNDFEKNLNEIENELTFALSKMEEDAKVFLLSAKLSKEDTTKAQELFNHGKYIESINASFNPQKNSQTGFFSLSFIDLPLQIYPLFGVIFFIAFKKFFYKKKKKRRKKTKVLSDSV